MPLMFYNVATTYQDLVQEEFDGRCLKPVCVYMYVEFYQNPLASICKITKNKTKQQTNKFVISLKRKLNTAPASFSGEKYDVE